MVKKELVNELATRLEMTKVDAENMLNDFCAVLADLVAEGNDVTLSGVGKIEIHERGERNGVNPKTKEKIVIAAHKTVGFKACKSLKDAVKAL